MTRHLFTSEAPGSFCTDLRGGIGPEPGCSWDPRHSPPLPSRLLTLSNFPITYRRLCVPPTAPGDLIHQELSSCSLLCDLREVTQLLWSAVFAPGALQGQGPHCNPSETLADGLGSQQSCPEGAQEPVSQSSPSQEAPSRHITVGDSPVPQGPCGWAVPCSGNLPGPHGTAGPQLSPAPGPGASGGAVPGGSSGEKVPVTKSSLGPLSSPTGTCSPARPCPVCRPSRLTALTDRPSSAPTTLALAETLHLPCPHELGRARGSRVGSGQRCLRTLSHPPCAQST